MEANSRIMEPFIDHIDALIINALIVDGRKSFRQIGKEIGVSTPTVNDHYKKLIRFGIIKSISPIFDLEKIQNLISAIVFIKISNPVLTLQIAKEISTLDDVTSVQMTTGEFNLIVKVIGDTPQDIEEFIRNKITKFDGIDLLNFQIITRTIKEDSKSLVKEGIRIRLQCDYCNNDIDKNLKIFKFGHHERNFCCGSCLKLYEQKYKGRILSLTTSN